ncbi:MAG: zinc-binding dehydrogenase [Candidatus Entotheonellia bacterium]
MTAHRCVFADRPVTGKTVLVTGGAGAVAHYAIQLATLHGAQVIATVSSEQKAQIALAAGADATLNYRTEDTVKRLMDLTGGAGVDQIVEVDFAGNFKVSREVLRRNGVLAVYAAGVAPQPPVPLQFTASNLTLRFVLVYDMPEPARHAAVAAITQLLAGGKLRHLAGPRFPLESARQAHQAVEGGAMGKVVLEVAEYP